MMATLKSQVKHFGGVLSRYTHVSEACKCSMTFAVYMPAVAESKPVPTVYYLSGLTCTDENFSQKAGFGRAASARGVCLIMPDTSPRDVVIEGADDSYDFGSGAGFYVDATEPKWAANYKMYSYVTQELPALVQSMFPGKLAPKTSIFGHSMGGHGALTLYLKNPGMYTSCSAFSPICNPTKCPWGEKAFNGYLGSVDAGKANDATELMLSLESPPKAPILIDQGTADNFYCGDVNQLNPAAFASACEAKGVPLKLRMQEGYDHSYFFISSFVDDHINFHADALGC